LRAASTSLHQPPATTAGQVLEISYVLVEDRGDDRTERMVVEGDPSAQTGRPLRAYPIVLLQTEMEFSRPRDSIEDGRKHGEKAEGVHRGREAVTHYIRSSAKYRRNHLDSLKPSRRSCMLVARYYPRCTNVTDSHEFEDFHFRIGVPVLVVA